MNFFKSNTKFNIINELYSNRLKISEFCFPKYHKKNQALRPDFTKFQNLSKVALRNTYQGILEILLLTLQIILNMYLPHL